MTSNNMFRSTEQHRYTCSELEKEAEADAVLYRNTFGTQPRKPWGPLQNAFDLYLKNPANTNVVLWGDRLLALWEVCCQATNLRRLCLCINKKRKVYVVMRSQQEPVEAAAWSLCNNSRNTTLCSWNDVQLAKCDDMLECCTDCFMFRNNLPSHHVAMDK